MNETIVKIVGTLFEDLDDSAEVRALHDEILTNCQERYADNIEAGMSEDDAIHDVMENLRGMEDLLKDYPHKSEAVSEEPKAWTCDPAAAGIDKIHLAHLGGASVRIFPSGDGLIHAECSPAAATLVTSVSGGVLSIALTDEKPDHLPVTGADFSDLRTLFSRLCKRLSDVLEPVTLSLSIPKNLHAALEIEAERGDVEACNLTVSKLNVASSSGDMKLSEIIAEGDAILTTASGDQKVHRLQAQTLEACAASGDIEMANLTLERLKANTASGDMELGDVCAKKEIAFNTASGDVSLRDTCSASVKINSASGDIEAEDIAVTESLSLTSSHGDIRMSGTASNLFLRTASGDISAAVSGQTLTEMRCESNSGDVNVHLPAGLKAVILGHSRTGDCRILSASDPSAEATVELITNSGDITVR